MFRHYDPSIFSSRPSLFCSADDAGSGGAAGAGSGGAAAAAAGGAGKDGAGAAEGKGGDGKDAGDKGAGDKSAAAGDDDKPVTMSQLKALLADALKGKPADAGKEADKGAAAAKGKDGKAAGDKGAESPDFVPRADFEALQERLNKLEKHDERSVREARLALMRDAGIKAAYEKFVPDNWDPTTDAGRAVAETFRKDHADMFEDRKGAPAGGGASGNSGGDGSQPAQTRGRTFAAKVAGALARR